MEKYMELAIKVAEKALKRGDVPVGAIIVYNNKVVAKAYNKKQKKGIATRHAEIEAIEKACKKLKTWHLDDCELYITMEPCLMCAGAILQARIKKVIYGVNNEKFGCATSIQNLLDSNRFNHNTTIVNGILKEKNEKILKDFFKQMRNK